MFDTCNRILTYWDSESMFSILSNFLHTFFKALALDDTLKMNGWVSTSRAVIWKVENCWLFWWISISSTTHIDWRTIGSTCFNKIIHSYIIIIFIYCFIWSWWYTLVICRMVGQCRLVNAEIINIYENHNICFSLNWIF